MLAYISCLLQSLLFSLFSSKSLTFVATVSLLCFWIFHFDLMFSHDIEKKKNLCLPSSTIAALKAKLLHLSVWSWDFSFHWKWLKTGSRYRYVQATYWCQYLLMTATFQIFFLVINFFFWSVRTYTIKFYSNLILSCLNWFLTWGTENLPILCIHLCIYLCRITVTDSSVFPLLYPHIKIQCLPVFFPPFTQMSLTHLQIHWLEFLLRRAWNHSIIES